MYLYASELAAVSVVLLWYAFFAFIFVGPFVYGLRKRSKAEQAECFVLFALFIPMVFFMVIVGNTPSESLALRYTGMVAAWCLSTYLIGLLIPRFTIHWPSKKN
ncbi:MAG: hypothetical protein Q8Q36_01535 [bacterium]|nr:hypothetical protein [bacterium]